MKISLSIISFLYFTCSILGQNTTYSFDYFTASLNNSVLKVTNRKGELIYKRKFMNPAGETIDLDADSVDEFVLIDSYNKGWKIFYTLYIFNTIDSFYLADSLNSGMMEPYISFKTDLKGAVIVSGNPDFDKFNNDSLMIFLPVNCWKYENGTVYIVNSDIYDLFLSLNEDIIDFLDQFYQENSKNCSDSKKVIPALAAGYANYINAGEKLMADKLINKYYFCNNLNRFKSGINNLLK